MAVVAAVAAAVVAVVATVVVLVATATAAKEEEGTDSILETSFVCRCSCVQPVISLAGFCRLRGSPSHQPETSYTFVGKLVLSFLIVFEATLTAQTKHQQNLHFTRLRRREKSVVSERSPGTTVQTALSVQAWSPKFHEEP